MQIEHTLIDVAVSSGLRAPWTTIAGKTWGLSLVDSEHGHSRICGMSPLAQLESMDGSSEPWSQ